MPPATSIMPRRPVRVNARRLRSEQYTDLPNDWQPGRLCCIIPDSARKGSLHAIMPQEEAASARNGG